MFLNKNKTKKSENIFVSILNELHVKYTKAYTLKFYQSHSNKHNMLGLSQMLSEYGIPNQGVRLKEKENAATRLEAPFIAHFGTGFITVKKMTEEETVFSWSDHDDTVSTSAFIEAWSGIALLAETTKDSKEPNYQVNRFFELGRLARIVIICICGAILLFEGFFINNTKPTVFIFSSLIVNFIGIYICYLLLLKQLKVQSKYADRICTVFGKSSCNNVLESPAAKVGGVIGWSEIGIGYFLSNILVLSFLPQFLPYYILINVCALPYTIWSVWYQKVRVKQWCPLCIVIQVNLWCIFLVNILFSNFIIPHFVLADIVFVGALYCLPIVFINFLAGYLSESGKAENITQELNSLKLNDTVFAALYNEKRTYPVSKSTSNILFGNKNSSTLITVFTNPHCEPCGRTHKKIDKLLDLLGDDICVQYIFTSFYEELDESNKYLISAYFHKVNKKKIFNDWFDKGKYKKDLFVNKYDIDIDLDEVREEFQKHERWKQETALRATPTILINGHELPEYYLIEDLKYLLVLLKA